MTPHGTAPQGLVVAALYKNGSRSIRRRGQLLVSEGVISFSPFEPTGGAVEVSKAVASITITRRRTPWSGDQFLLDGPPQVRVTVPRRSRRRVHHLLSAAGIRVHEQT
jgi:hypothetical protein